MERETTAWMVWNNRRFHAPVTGVSMNSAYTGLEQSLACKEMGAKQIESQPLFIWWRHLRGLTQKDKEWHLDYYVMSEWYHAHRHGRDQYMEYVAALPFYTDDPTEQSVVKLLESLDLTCSRTDNGRWYLYRRGVMELYANSLGVLLMAYYEKWKLNHGI